MIWINKTKIIPKHNRNKIIYLDEEMEAYAR